MTEAGRRNDGGGAQVWRRRGAGMTEAGAGMTEAGAQVWRRMGHRDDGGGEHALSDPSCATPQLVDSDRRHRKAKQSARP